MRIAGVVASLLVLADARTALAYQRATVDGVPERGLVWSDRAIGLELASSTSTDVASAELRAALARSLATWSAPTCTDIVMTDVGEALGLSTNLVDGSADGRNRVVVRRSGWPAEVGPETLALTTIIYQRDTGRIVDADIDLNASAHSFASSTPAAPDKDDIENTLTHEAGHLLGFAHVTDPEATMFARATLGETLKRDLAPDDVLAICETYPRGLPTPTTLSHPAAHSGCSAVRSRSMPPFWVPLVLLSALAARRSRRRARAAETAS